MAVDNIVHINECGLPLNANDWLERHHQSKFEERRNMVRDLLIAEGSFVVDAGCGPGLWTHLLAEAVGVEGRILGIDISSEALITAQRRTGTNAWNRPEVVYRRASLEKIPVKPGEVDLIFSANVSQYLADPVAIFRSMRSYLRPGGRLVIKDIDFGTMRFSNVDPDLQHRVFEARARWEQERVQHDYAYEDSWVGPKLAHYLRAAGYLDVVEHTYTIVRHAPLSADFRFYLQGIAAWFVCEDAPYLSKEDIAAWNSCFQSEQHSVFDQDDFTYEETEYVVSGV
ncbi:MAG TPA: methyltransferase domain-containing protein [Dictyobacter sp.]|nr:methyltransferase domain-containing protein [Dictyobacter sp.]